jgi:transposase
MPEVTSRSNPRRLPRRNHYQEGPGFLFVATQGGRPPEGELTSGLARSVRRRRAAFRRWAEGEPIATISNELGCSRASMFRWRTRYEADGLAGLLDRPRVGRASELPPAIERLVLTVRLLTYWNSRRIAAEFRRRDVWPLSHGQVDRLLARHGTHRPSYVRTPGPRLPPPPRRARVADPGERFDGTPFTDRGFSSVPSLAGVADLLDAILAA